MMAANEVLGTDIAQSVQLDVDKAYLACGDAWLYRHGAYDHRLLVRVERFRGLLSMRVGPTARLHEEYERSARQRLLPSPDISLRQTAHRARWCRTVEEWLSCYESHVAWGRSFRHGSPPVTARWHPVRAVKHTVGAVRRLILGLPTEQQQWDALPVLLQLALRNEAEDSLYAIASTLLRTRAASPPALEPLVRRFMLVWHPSGAKETAAGSDRAPARQPSQQLARYPI